jgi:hypothetical protein
MQGVGSLFGIVLWLNGCLPALPAPPDFDGDGVTIEEGDCDDEDAALHPGTVWYGDGDGDGYGSDADAVTQCQAPDAHVLFGGDCADDDPTVHPSADEVCDDADQDCDEVIDEDVAVSTYYVDSDEDGFGDAAEPVVSCAPPSGAVLDAQDCDDTSADVNPNADEICNGVDDDCDTSTDAAASDAPSWFLDNDEDGYGLDASELAACDRPTGYVAEGGDCDDGDDAYHPGAAETCTDTVDFDCDGAVGFVDEDGDGWAACLECDDDAALVNPGATEVCDAVDNDCDGTTDEGAVDEGTWYLDADEDGYGLDAASAAACALPPGYAAAGGDCDDGDASTNPAGTEVCGGGDEDCDTLVDDADGGVTGASTWYADLDGDGDGDAADAGALGCVQPSATSATHDDCDDTDPHAYAGAPELCDGGPNDCSTGWVASDEDGLATWVDADGAASDVTTAIAGAPGVPSVYPLPADGAVTLCDGTFYARITVGDSVATLQSLNGATATTLDAEASGTGVWVYGVGTPTLIGLTITDGSGTDQGGYTVGGGVWVGNGASLTIEDAVLTGNTATSGGGARVSVSATLTLTGSTLTSNTAAQDGGALHVLGGDVSITDSEVSWNTADSGGGLFLSGSGSLTLTTSTVANNAATSAGGGIAAYGGAVTLTDTLVRANTAHEGGGLYADDPATVDCAGSVGVAAGFLSNVAAQDGGAAYVTSSAFTSTACDWGVGGTDNSPDDVYHFASYAAFGDDETFACDGVSCL